MRTSLRPVTAILLAVFSSVLPISAEDGSKEPPLAFTLTIDGKPVAVELGKEKTISGEFRDPKIKLEAAPTRRFQYAGIQFEYPATYGWDWEVDEGSKIWTIDGNDLQVIVIQGPTAMTARDYFKTLAEELKFPLDSIEESKRTFGGVTYKSSKLKVTLAGIKTLLEVLEIPVETGSLLLGFQDMEPDGDKPGKEAIETMKLIEKTFRKGAKL